MYLVDPYNFLFPRESKYRWSKIPNTVKGQAVYQSLFVPGTKRDIPSCFILILKNIQL